MSLIPNGAVTACSYEYINNANGSTTQTWTDCMRAACPQSSAHQAPPPPPTTTR